MKIHCPNFVPKSGCFYQISVKVCPKQLPFPSFQGNFMTWLFLLKFLFFQARNPSKKSTFVLNFWLFYGKKSEKLHYLLKKREISGLLME